MNSLMRWGLLCAILFSALACNDDEDDVASPRVFIDAPTENQIVFSVDTLLVEARITHDRGITSAEIELVDEDFNPVAPKAVYSASGTDHHLSEFYTLNKPLFSSGIYYIAVRASDGSKTGSGFKRVQLSAVPRVLQRVMVGLRATNLVRIAERTSNGNWVDILTRTMDCRGVGLNYRHNILAMAGGEIGDLEFFETGEFEQIGSVPGLGTPSLPYFLGLEYSREFEEFIALQRDPRLRAFDRRAAPAAGFPLNDDHLPLAVFTANDRYYVNESPISQPNQLLTVYARPGLLLNTFELGGPAIGVFARNPFEVFVWENNPEGLKLRLIDVEGQLVSDIFQRNGEELRAVAEIQSGFFAFLTDQALLRYNYNTGATTTVSNNVDADRMFYDDLSQHYYLASGSTLTQMSQGGDVISVSEFSSEVFWVGFDYNR
ncbi:MAG: hypothetical protein ABR572_10735 [Cryomorphaceae bacterium]